MPLAKNISAYTDVHAVLTAALERGGASYRLPSASKAKHWRARAYMYRTLLRQSAQERTMLSPSTPFDTMVLTISPNDPSLVQIHVQREAEGELLDESGNPIDLDRDLAPPPAYDDPNPQHPEYDELEDAALALRKRLSGED